MPDVLNRQIDLFPLIELGDRRLVVGGDGCVKPIGRFDRGRRRRHASRPGIPGQLLELRTLRQARRNEHESLPAVLRRVTDIERHLALVETPQMPRLSRRRPLDG
jgi:hypothetical protein